MIPSRTILIAYNVNLTSLWVLPTLIGIIVIARVGWYLIKRYRRQVLGDDGIGNGWTLDDLERMRDSQQISEQEFKILRDQVMRGFMASGRSNLPGKSTSPGKRNDKIGE